MGEDGVVEAGSTATVPWEPFTSALKVDPQIWNGEKPFAVGFVPSICSTNGVPFGPLMLSEAFTKNTMLSVPLETNERAAKNMLGETAPLVVALKLALPSKTNSTPLVPSGPGSSSETPPNGPKNGFPLIVFETVPLLMFRLASWK